MFLKAFSISLFACICVCDVERRHLIRRNFVNPSSLYQRDPGIDRCQPIWQSLSTFSFYMLLEIFLPTYTYESTLAYCTHIFLFRPTRNFALSFLRRRRHVEISRKTKPNRFLFMDFSKSSLSESCQVRLGAKKKKNSGFW